MSEFDNSDAEFLSTEPSSSEVEVSTLVPSELATESIPHYIEVTENKLVARYTAAHRHDFGTIRSTEKIPPKTFIYYYEVEILSSSEHSTIAIGLAPISLPETSQVGCQLSTYAYISEKGRKRSVSEHPYGPSFIQGDIVGCGINYHSNEVFFTKNGSFLGNAFSKVSGEFYPTVTLQSPGDCVRFKFEDFLFDFDKLIKEEREKMNQCLSEKEFDTVIVKKLVYDYLLRNGYSETAKAFLKTCEFNYDEMALKEVYESVSDRKEIRVYIEKGNVKEAISLLRFKFEKVAERKEVMFALYSQMFIEFIRSKMLSEAVQLSQRVLIGFKDIPEINAGEIENIMALLAYSDPLNCPLSFLCDQKRRFEVANYVNSAILESMNASSLSPLYRLMKQLMACDRVLREENFEMGEPLSLVLN